ncbi:hypothetical protein [Nocardia wallacei]|uniref:hypothetical protein n=1 Tax=Nocardia wallacei TaxID=480035 RepID=UPI002454C808|nr:hypothetical protein [Nocardia wallacei]
MRGIRPDLTLTARPAGYRGIGQGCGRLQELRVAVEVSGRNLRPRHGELRLTADGPGSTGWARTSPKAAVAARRWSRTG